MHIAVFLCPFFGTFAAILRIESVHFLVRLFVIPTARLNIRLLKVVKEAAQWHFIAFYKHLAYLPPPA